MAIAQKVFGTPASVSHAEGQGHAREGGVTVYWRPGCSACMALRFATRRYASRARWVNIWRDPDAASFVRSVNGGDETVPVVVMNHAPVTNPVPGRVRAALADAA